MTLSLSLYIYISLPRTCMLVSQKYLRQMLVQVRARMFEQAAIILARRKIPMHNTVAVIAGGKSSMFEFYDTDVNVTYFRCEFGFIGRETFPWHSNTIGRKCKMKLNRQR